MLNRRSLSCIVITLSLVSCFHVKQLPAPAWYNSPAATDTTKLRFDGYYTNISDPIYTQQKYTAADPVLFTPKNRIYVVAGAYVISDSSIFTCKHYREVDPAYLGKYFIEENRISAFAPVIVSLGEGAAYRLVNLHFSGTIVNKELISNWQAIPPYPKRITKRDIENSQNDGLFRAHDLKFVKADSVRCLNPYSQTNSK